MSMRRFTFPLQVVLLCGLVAVGCQFPDEKPGTDPQTTKTSVVKKQLTIVPYLFVGSSELRINRHGKCLDLTNGSTSNGANIQQWDCSTGHQNQQFRIVADGDYVRIKHSSSGKCVDVSGGQSNSPNGTNIQLWNCVAGEGNQLFTLEPIEGKFLNNEFSIRNKKTNKCLDLSSGGSSNGTNIQLWTCSSDNTNQRFSWKGVFVPKGSTTIISDPSGRRANNECLDLSGGNTANGGNIQIWNCFSDFSNQQFTFVPDGNYIRIKHTASGKCVDVSGGQSNSPNGTNIQLWSCVSGEANQLFTLENLGANDFMIRNKKTNKCLKRDGNDSNGTNIVLWSCSNNSASQHFGWGGPQLCIKTKDQSNAGTKDTIKLSYLHQTGIDGTDITIFDLYSCKVFGVERGGHACCYMQYKRKVENYTFCEFNNRTDYFGAHNSGSDAAHITKVYVKDMHDNHTGDDRTSVDSFFCESGMSSCHNLSGTLYGYFKLGQGQEINVSVDMDRQAAGENRNTYGVSIESCTHDAD